MLKYRTLDGGDCFVNPRLVTLVTALGDDSARIHFTDAGHHVDVATAAEEVADDIAAGAEPVAPADPTMNLLS